MKGTLLGLVIFAYLCQTSSQQETYEGYEMWRATAENDLQRQYLRHLDDIARNRKLMTEWRSRSELDLLAHSSISKRLAAIFKLLKLKYTKKLYNYNRHVELTKEYSRRQIETRSGPPAYNLTSWNSLEQIYQAIEDFIEGCPVELTCTVVDIGQSYEKRPIKLIKISSGQGKRAVVIDSLIHAREWVAGSTMLLTVERLTRGYSGSSDVSGMLDNYDFYIIPVLNPDGYVFTWENDRMWRKNRMPNKNSRCVGTDLNRNLDIDWGNTDNKGASHDPCAETYAGSAPNSAPEIQVYVKVAATLAPLADVWLNLHSHASMWLIPYSHLTNGECRPAPNSRFLMRLAAKAKTASTLAAGDLWAVGPGCKILYPSAGTAKDYLYQLNIPFVSTVELRGENFDPDVSDIPKAFKEFWNGLRALISELEQVKKDSSSN